MERKVATVLFADLVDSTGLGEGDPEQTRALLERFYAAMAALDRWMEGYGATLDTCHARRRNYLRPFALRALGRVRGDEALVREALAEFEAYRLGWFAAETRASL